MFVKKWELTVDIAIKSFCFEVLFKYNSDSFQFDKCFNNHLALKKIFIYKLINVSMKVLSILHNNAFN